ncbi:histone deacetylase family protein, partial [Xanthomonas oryzae pv. oryzae]
MLVFTHPACLGHDAGPEHPESPARLEAVLDALRAAFPDLDWREAPLAKLGDLCRVHEREQVDAVLETAFDGYRQLDVDTRMVPASRAAALR